MGTTSLVAGVIGLGDIGRGVAGSLVRGGVDLVVFDVRPDATSAFADSAVVADSPEDLAARSDVVVVAVLDDAQVLAVVDGAAGALSGAKPGSVLLVLSTVAPETVRQVADRAAGRHVDVLDCGVSGGPEAAADGSLVAMVGGDDQVIERARPVLDAFSSMVVRMGPLGAGLQAKLARNLVQYGSWLAAYEGQVLAEAAGIELAKLAEVIRDSDKKIGGASRLMFRTTVAPFTHDDHPVLVNAMEAAARLAHKDLRAALELADRLGVSLPLAAMADERADAVFGLSPDVSAPSEKRRSS